MTALAHSVAIESSSGAAVLRPLGHWPKTLLELLQSETAVVRVVIASLRGSGPREAGACMLVTRDAIAGSVGGGHLEWQAITAARALLDAAPGSAQLKRYVLGIELGQCCGGVVELWYERFYAADRGFLARAIRAVESSCGAAVIESILEGSTATRKLADDQLKPSPPGRGLGEGLSKSGTVQFADLPHPCPSPGGRGVQATDRDDHLVEGEIQQRRLSANQSIRLIRDADKSVHLIERLQEPRAPLWLFGAGHVGHAIVRVLEGLPFRLAWIDSRADLFPAMQVENIEQFRPADPVSMVAKAPSGTRFLILTHDHALDYALVRAVLARDDFSFLGVIGSDSKGARFRSRLERDGISAYKIAQLICPIGVAGIASKQPAAIAISVVAQLLQGLTDLPETSAPELASTADDDCMHATPGGCANCGNRAINTSRKI